MLFICDEWPIRRIVQLDKIVYFTVIQHNNNSDPLPKRHSMPIAKPWPLAFINLTTAFWIFLALTTLPPVIAQTMEQSESAEMTSNPPFDYAIFRDPAIEARLDAIIEVGFYPPDHEQFHLILQNLNASTPVDTYIRAQSYRVYELILRDEDSATAHQVLAKMQQRTESSDALEATLETLMTEAHVYLLESRLAEALAAVVRIDELVAQVKNPRLIFFANHLIGRILQQNSQYEEALEYLLRSHQAIEQTEEALKARRYIFVNLHIARLHAELRNDESALDIAEKAIQLAQDNELYARLPDLYLLQGFIEGREGPTERALANYYQAIEWAEQVTDNRVRLLGRNNAGSILLLLEQYDEAREILQEGLALSEALGRQQEADIMRFNLAYINVMQGYHEEGLAQMEAATERYRTYAREAEIADWLEFLASAYEHAGRHQQQAQTLLEQRRLREEIFRSERDQVVNALQLRFDTQEQSRQIELLRQRSELQQEQLSNQHLQQRISRLIVLVIVLVGIIMYFSYRTLRQKNAKLNEANRKLHDQSIRDPLTGLLNRRSWQQTIASHKRLPGEKDALFLIDIDLFKQINDQQGHAAGDEVLITLASRLRRICRDSDLIVRWGGEEFLLVLRHTHTDALPNFAQRLLHAVGAEPFMYAGQPIHVTATAGFITLPLNGLAEDDKEWERALQITDLLLYYGKSHGRNQVNGIIGLHEIMDTELEQALFNDISQAIDQNWVDSVHIQGPVKSS